MEESEELETQSLEIINSHTWTKEGSVDHKER